MEAYLIPMGKNDPALEKKSGIEPIKADDSGGDFEKLLGEARQGNESSVLNLVSFARPIAAKVAWFVLRDKSEIDDVVQDTIWKLLRDESKFDSPEAIKRWIRITAERNSLNRTRNRKRYLESKNETPTRNINSKDSTDVLEQKERFVLLENAIHSLSESLRIPFLMIYSQKKSHKEVSHALGISAENVRARLYRARSKLREKLGEIQP